LLSLPTNKDTSLTQPVAQTFSAIDETLKLTRREKAALSSNGKAAFKCFPVGLKEK
jgi:hypothetical protein